MSLAIANFATFYSAPRFIGDVAFVQEQELEMRKSRRDEIPREFDEAGHDVDPDVTTLLIDVLG